MAGLQIPLDEVAYFDVITQSSTGQVSDADSVPTWAVYEESSDIAILSGSMIKRSALTGNYRASFTVSTSNGFEAGKFYSVIVEGTVGGVTGKCIALMFRCIPIENMVGVPNVDLVAISGSRQTLQNFGYTYDGTGYSNDYAPAQQQQLAKIANVGAAVNTTAENCTLVTGLQTAGTYESTYALDDSYHTIEDDANVTDFHYHFNVGKDGVPTSVTWDGYARGNGDVYNVYASGSSGWVQVGKLTGTSSWATSVSTESWQLTTDHVDSNGIVKLRFYSTEGTELNTDRILCSYAVVYRSVGYEDGAVWIDTVNGTAGTTPYINGTADNPVDTLSDALTIANLLDLKRFHVINGSTITLDNAYRNYSFIGDGMWNLHMNNQDISGTYIESAHIIGSGYNAIAHHPLFCQCAFGNNSGNVYLPRHRATECVIYNPDYNIVISSGITVWDRCSSAVAGNATPTVQFADQWVDFNCRGYMGGLTFKNMVSGNRASFDCPAGQLQLSSTCTGGEIRRAGFNRFRDYSGGAVNVTDGYGMTIYTDANGMVGVSGIVDANIVQVSGEYVSQNNLKYQDSSIYFADISHIYDGANNQDEYTVQWFKDSQPLNSGDIITPSFSVYDTNDGTAKILHQSMNYASSTLGVVRYNETTNILASGEPYLVVASGIIDSQLKTWKSIVGFNIM